MMRFRQLDWYQAPAYYDLVFEGLSAREAEFLGAIRAEYGPRGGPGAVLEPACGSGRLLERMAHRGFDVHGIDLSPAMVEYARARLSRAGLPGRVVVGDMSAFRTRRRFDMAYCLVSSFKYLLTEHAARSHLTAVASALRPGGVYVLGFHLTDYDQARCERERWLGTRGSIEVVCNITSWPPDRRRRLEQMRSRLRVRRGDQRFGFETRWSFRTYDVGQVRRLLSSAPELQLVATYDMTYDLDREQELGAEQLDQVLVLRRR